ncbi:MAG: hypothetical protein P8182_04795 [Deltaproteobacteria bacterium]
MPIRSRLAGSFERGRLRYDYQCKPNVGVPAVIDSSARVLRDADAYGVVKVPRIRRKRVSLRVIGWADAVRTRGLTLLLAADGTAVFEENLRHFVIRRGGGHGGGPHEGKHGRGGAIPHGAGNGRGGASSPRMIAAGIPMHAPQILVHVPRMLPHSVNGEGGRHLGAQSG